MYIWVSFPACWMISHVPPFSQCPWSLQCCSGKWSQDRGRLKGVFTWLEVGCQALSSFSEHQNKSHQFFCFFLSHKVFQSSAELRYFLQHRYSLTPATFLSILALAPKVSCVCSTNSTMARIQVAKAPCKREEQSKSNCLKNLWKEHLWDWKQSIRRKMLTDITSFSKPAFCAGAGELCWIYSPLAHPSIFTGTRMTCALPYNKQKWCRYSLENHQSGFTHMGHWWKMCKKINRQRVCLHESDFHSLSVPFLFQKL